MSKDYLYIIIGILIVIVLSLLTHNTSERIIFNDSTEGLTHDFGVLSKNKYRKYECNFKYVNKAYDTLKVYGVKDACDCTESNVKSKLYFRNDTITVRTIYDPLKYKDSGFIAKKIFLITDSNISKYDTLYPLALKGFIK